MLQESQGAQAYRRYKAQRRRGNGEVSERGISNTAQDEKGELKDCVDGSSSLWNVSLLLIMVAAVQTYKLGESKARTARYHRLPNEKHQPWERKRDEDGRREDGENDLFEFQREVKVSATPLDAGAEGIVVHARRDAHRQCRSQIIDALLQLCSGNSKATKGGPGTF